MPKAIGFDGKTRVWNLTKSRKSQNPSKLHIKVREFLETLYPLHPRLEEIKLPGSGKPPLYADFYLPLLSLVIEAHGEQHFKFNSYFFETKLEFYQAKARDIRKKEWCELNNIILVEFNYNESDREWSEKLRRKIDGVRTEDRKDGEIESSV